MQTRPLPSLLLPLLFVPVGCADSHERLAPRECALEPGDERRPLAETPPSFSIRLDDSGDVEADVRIGAMPGTRWLEAADWISVNGVELDEDIADWGPLYRGSLPRSGDDRYALSLCYRGELFETVVETRPIRVLSPPPGERIDPDHPPVVRWEPDLGEAGPPRVWIGGCVYSASAMPIDGRSAAFPALVRGDGPFPCEGTIELVVVGETEVASGYAGWSQSISIPTRFD